MSRIGKLPVKLQGSTAQIAGRKLTIKGAKGELSFNVPDSISFKHENDEIVFTPNDNSKKARTLWGTSRALTNNRVKGVKEGFSVTLELQGVGYRASVQNGILNITLGFSHEIRIAIPKSLTVTCPTQTEILISGADKQMVGQFAAETRELRKPEPYKGKGVRRKGEFVRRKEGKKK
jgi:large subunit ribosomal protein L6